MPDNGDPTGLELFGCMTPNVLKVMFLLEELGRPYAFRHVRIYRGDNFAEGFERLHPYRKLPVLVDHGDGASSPHPVFESGAILIYLAEQAGRLLGEGSIERSLVMQWLMLQMSSVGPAFGNATHFRSGVQEDHAYARRRFTTQAARLCALYDRRLAEMPFLAGDDFTIADIATFPWLWRHPAMIGLNPEEYPFLQRWIAAIAERPGLKKAHLAYREIVRIDRADIAKASPDLIDRLMGRGLWFAPDIGAFGEH